MLSPEQVWKNMSGEHREQWDLRLHLKVNTQHLKANAAKKSS